MSDLKKRLRKPKPVSVSVAETGEDVLLRYWTFAEKDRLARTAVGPQADESQCERHLCDVVRCSLVDADGDPLYGPDDDAEIMAIPAVLLAALYREATSLNDITKDKVDAAKKNSTPTPSGDGSSNGPKTTDASRTSSPSG